MFWGSRKGQGAFEYLLIIGAAILIGLIVITIALSFVAQQKREVSTEQAQRIANILDQGIKLVENCYDGIDNDEDGKMDLDDPDCDPNSPVFNPLGEVNAQIS